MPIRHIAVLTVSSCSQKVLACPHGLGQHYRRLRRRCSRSGAEGSSIEPGEDLDCPSLASPLAPTSFLDGLEARAERPRRRPETTPLHGRTKCHAEHISTGPLFFPYFDFGRSTTLIKGLQRGEHGNAAPESFSLS